MSDNNNNIEITANVPVSKLSVPTDLPSRVVSLGRVIARLPDGQYTIQLTKDEKRIQADITENVPVRHVSFDQDDQRKD